MLLKTGRRLLQKIDLVMTGIFLIYFMREVVKEESVVQGYCSGNFASVSLHTHKGRGKRDSSLTFLDPEQ